MTRLEPESRCAGIWPVLAHFRTVRCFTRSSCAASDAVSHSEVITTAGPQMTLLMDRVRGKGDSLIVDSSRKNGLVAAFGWTRWELMVLFISRIAPCVKMHAKKETEIRGDMRACLQGIQNRDFSGEIEAGLSQIWQLVDFEDEERGPSLSRAHHALVGSS